MNPPRFADTGAAASSPLEPEAASARSFAALCAEQLGITEAEFEEEVAKFGRWYESQPPEWIAELSLASGVTPQ